MACQALARPSVCRAEGAEVTSKPSVTWISCAWLTLSSPPMRVRHDAEQEQRLALVEGNGREARQALAGLSNRQADAAAALAELIDRVAARGDGLGAGSPGRVRKEVQPLHLLHMTPLSLSRIRLCCGSSSALLLSEVAKIGIALQSHVL